MSVSYAVDFASLLLLGPHETMLVAAGSAFSQCHLNSKERNPLHRTLFSMASLVITVQARASRSICSAAPASAMTITALARPLVGAATVYFLLNTGLVATAIALSTRDADRRDLAQQLPLERAELLRRRAAARRSPPGSSTHAGYWVAPLTFAPLYLTYRTYKVYMGRIEDEQRHVQQTSDLHLATIEALARAIDAKDQTTQMHIRRVQIYAAGLAEALGLSEPEIQGIKTAALLHDIGKLAVPEHILSKPGPLTQEEFQKIRIHPQVGAEIIAGGAVPVSGGAADPEPPRAVGRQGLSAGAGRRGDPARRAHPDHRRLLRRGDDRAAVPQGAQLRERDRPAEARSRARARSEAGADLHRAAAVADRGARPGRSGDRAGRTGGGAAGIDRGRPGAGAERQRVREHRARAPRDLRALRNRAVDGHQPRRVRHDGADLVEADEDRPVVGLRAVPAPAGQPTR